MYEDEFKRDMLALKVCGGGAASWSVWKVGLSCETSKADCARSPGGDPPCGISTGDGERSSDRLLRAEDR